MDETGYNKWYIKLDGELIIDAWSDGPNPEKDTDGAICVNEQGDYQFKVDGVENPILFGIDDRPLYAWRDGEIVSV